MSIFPLTEGDVKNLWKSFVWGRGHSKYLTDKCIFLQSEFSESVQSESVISYNFPKSRFSPTMVGYTHLRKATNNAADKSLSNL